MSSRSIVHPQEYHIGRAAVLLRRVVQSSGDAYMMLLTRGLERAMEEHGMTPGLRKGNHMAKVRGKIMRQCLSVMNGRRNGSEVWMSRPF
jgi:hypothetical protein